MTSLAAYALSLILYGFPPGYSPASLELLPQCGAEQQAPPCDVRPVCPSTMTACGSIDGGAPCCAIPFWFEGLGWVRTETREAGAKRLEVVAQAIADASLFHGSGWREGPRDLVRAVISAGGWGMGFREDVQTGRTRGKAGEVCLMDLMPRTLRMLTPYGEQKGKTDAELAAATVGRDYDSQRRCFDAGALLMVRVRREAERRCKGYQIDYATFALYATGTDCSTNHGPPKGDWLAQPRYDSIRKFRARKHTVFPAWYSPPKIED